MSGSNPELSDNDFDVVVVNSEDEYTCSPAEPEDINWRGILINAPKLARCSMENLRIKARIPICAYYFLDMDRDFSSKPFALVAKEVQSGKVFRGPVLQYEDGYEIPPPEDQDSGDSSVVTDLGGIGGYANPNLSDYVILPGPGTYLVTLERGRHRSNEVQIRLELIGPQSLP